MMLTARILIGGGLLAASVLPAASQGHQRNPLRHFYLMRNGLPAAYENVRNPMRPTAANLSAGKKLYGEHCQSCHGKPGMGDGEAGRDLKPPPSVLAGSHMPMIDDGYRLWAITDGGAALKTGMPAFKETLTLKQRWQVLLHIERGLPGLRLTPGGRAPHLRGRGMHR